jgi:hypothetical protein
MDEEEITEEDLEFAEQCEEAKEQALEEAQRPRII